jgi:thymidylate kinase
MRSPLLITFSGLDGAGKSTQIDNLRERLTAAGLKIKQLAFWDDVVVGTRYREGFVHKVYGSEKGIGAPDKPVNRRDKNMRAWYLTCLRHTMYLLDAINLRLVIARTLRSGIDVLIVDRYIYDELVNLPLERALTRGFVRFCAKLVPLPDIAYLLDADPEAARARKPEYPVDFLRQSRTAYHLLSNLLTTMTIIPPLPLAEAKAAVITACDRAILAKETRPAPFRTKRGIPASPSSARLGRDSSFRSE